MHIHDYAILGGGLAGTALASFLDASSIILEKEDRAGGLCRSFDLNGIVYDVGPHIIFSKNKDVLDYHTRIIETNRIRRVNNILFRGRWIKYPFENDLASLDAKDNEYCLQEFLNNPYERYNAGNMLQFFLRQFGEGMTRLYLAPYNAKIWKFDPSCLDLQMVERIPKPPREDVIKASQGEATEGYTHQLFFNYPKVGGIQSLFDAYARRAAAKSSTITACSIQKVAKVSDHWSIQTDQGEFHAQRLVNCMPIHALARVIDLPSEIRDTIDRLLYNSIHICMVQVKEDLIGDRFAVYVPDEDIIFHRLSKLNFLGESYCLPDGRSTLMAEITFRPGSYLGSLSHAEIEQRVVAGLVKAGLIKHADMVTGQEIRTFEYAYVIYDLDHRRNTDRVLDYLQSKGIESCGRFAEFEYVNTDQVIERVVALAERLNQRKIDLGAAA